MVRKESTKADDSKGPWVKTPVANLMRYEPKGTYYLRARVGGKIVRESLKTTDFAIAKIKVGERLSELRTSSAPTSGLAPKTLREALALLRVQIEKSPALKPSSREAYVNLIGMLVSESCASVPAAPLLKLDRRTMDDWWSAITATYSPQSSNQLLMMVRRALKLARKTGGILRDPTEGITPMRVPRTRLDLPTVEQLRAVVANIRMQPSDHRNESANWVEFMAYSGMRPGEVAAVQWEHIDERAGVISVYGGKHGTKNHESREVPIIPPMADLLRRMRNGEAKKGPVFIVRNPAIAFQRACKRLGLPRQRLYNLRHLFATTCRDSGVPVPTFAEWLGHKDGGALAMRTYVQRSDEHSKRAAQLVKFA